MEEIKYVTEAILTVEDLEDIFTTAIESGYEGIGYWGVLDNTTPEWDKAEKQITNKGETPYVGTVMVQVLLNGDALKFEDAEGEEDDSEWKMNIEKFKMGCTMYEKTRGSLTQKLKDGSFDAVEADCLMQYALFGEIIFG